MPLDTSIYPLALLRLDGRRWNELRRIHAQVGTQTAADGSSYLEMGNTKVLCTVAGPAELRRSAGAVMPAGGTTGTSGGSGSGVGAGIAGLGGGGGGGDDKASVIVEVNVAGFSGIERRKRGRGDRRIADLQHTISSAFASTLFTHLYPRSTISLSLHVLAQDGALLAACLNAATLALVDAGIPCADYLVACTAGSSVGSVPLSPNPKFMTGRGDGQTENPDPLLDLSGAEEQELPYLTVATVGRSEKVVVLVMESRVRVERVEGMLAVAVDGCKQVKEILDSVVRSRGKRLLDNAIG